MEKGNDKMNFDESLEMYVCEIEGVIFAFEEEQTGDYEENLKSIAEKYWNKIDTIVDFMLSDLQDMYGDVDADDVKENLGKPIIDLDRGQVDYCEQTFDDIHIFSFEFVDNDFDELQYFAIDG